MGELAERWFGFRRGVDHEILRLRLDSQAHFRVDFRSFRSPTVDDIAVKRRSNG